MTVPMVSSPSSPSREPSHRRRPTQPSVLCSLSSAINLRPHTFCRALRNRNVSSEGSTERPQHLISASNLPRLHHASFSSSQAFQSPPFRPLFLPLDKTVHGMKGLSCPVGRRCPNGARGSRASGSSTRTPWPATEKRTTSATCGTLTRPTSRRAARTTTRRRGTTSSGKVREGEDEVPQENDAVMHAQHFRKQKKKKGRCAKKERKKYPMRTTR